MDHIDRFTCENAFQCLDDYVDRELTPHEMRQVKAHLEICAQCMEEFSFEADVLKQIRTTLQRIRVPHDLMAVISSAIKRDQEYQGGLS
jgi:anti-sigma factor (TIGR02949 family)